MIPYLVCFFISTFFLGIAEVFRKGNPHYDVNTIFIQKKKKKNNGYFAFANTIFKTENKILWLLFSALGIFVICYFSGVRDLTIGTDTSIYPYKAYIYASNSASFKIFYTQASNEIVSEPLYILMVYFTTKRFGTFSSVLFVTTLLTVLPVYISLNQINQTYRKNYVWFAMLIFYLMYFPFSFNLGRQFIAIGISTLSYKYILKKNPFKFTIVIIIAMLFHTSAIVATPLYFLYWVTEYQGDNGQKIINRHFRALVKKYRLTLRIALIVVCAISILFVMKAIVFFAGLTGRYTYQLDKLGNRSSMVWRNSIFVLAFLLIWLPAIEQIQKYRKIYYYVFIYLISAVLFFSGWITREAYRIAYFYSIALVFVINEHIIVFHRISNRLLYMSLYFIIAFAYFSYFFVFLNWGHIVPYMSK